MYELIQHKVLTSNSATIDFTNIPQDGTDLLLLCSLRSTFVEHIDAAGLSINGSTANISSRRVWGAGATNLSYSAGTNNINYGYIGSTAALYTTANTFGNIAVTISNYTKTSAKSYSADETLSSAANGGPYPGYVELTITSGARSTAEPVTSLQIYPVNAGSSWVQGSSISLYKINRTSAIGRSPQAIGGWITYANGYWIHAFTGSGSFVPFNDMEVEYLIVAGGGGGTGDLSGGGGARALTAVSTLSSNTIYPVVVGAGGAGGNGAAGGVDGSASSFASNTCLGGPRAPGGSGSSRPGGAGSMTVNGVTTNYVGGPGGGSALTFPSREWRYGGGGAGAGGNGGDGNSISGSSNGTGGAGGPGFISSITGAPVEYAGGGGGGAYSTGGSASGGGASGSSYTGVQSTSDGQPATANTGGGGGGGSGLVNVMGTTGGAGGSGVVIVRYRA